MKKLLVILALALAVPGCGGIVPYIAPAVAIVETVGQLIDMFSGEITPDYEQAMDQCGELIATVADSRATELSAACAQLNDAYLDIEALVQQLQGERADRSAPIDDEARRLLDRWAESRARYQEAVE